MQMVPLKALHNNGPYEVLANAREELTKFFVQNTISGGEFLFVNVALPVCFYMLLSSHISADIQEK